jgi:type III secretion protein T
VTDNLLSLYTSLPAPDIWALILLCLARIVPIIALAPFFGAKVLPDTMKIGFGIALIPVFLPYLIIKSSGHIAFDIVFILLMVKEIFIGFLLGVMVSVPFYIAQGAGNLIDHQRGSQSLQVNDPSTQTQASPLGLIYNQILIVIFFSIGGPFLFFDALFTSYKLIPADQFLDPEFFAKTRPIWHLFIGLVTTMITISLQLAAPSLIAILMSDLFLGIANRMAPQVQISFLLWSLKAFIGIALLWAAWWFILKQMEVQSFTWLKTITKIVDSFG